jgi:hypothetical protein
LLGASLLDAGVLLGLFLVVLLRIIGPEHDLAVAVEG